MKPKDVLELAKANDVKFIDLKFIDFPGVWQHTQLPVSRLEGLTTRTPDGNEAQQLAKRMQKGSFDLNDLAEQLKQMQKKLWVIQSNLDCHNHDID